MTKMDKVIKKINKIVENISISEIDMRILIDEYFMKEVRKNRITEERRGEYE